MKTPGALWAGAAGRFDDRFSTLLRAPSIPSIATTQQDPDTWTLLDSATLIQVRRIWWSHRRRHGVRLPAERCVIVIDGGRP